MSARKRRLELEQAARDDLRAILLYTQEQWGSAQRVAYRDRLYDVMRRLTDFPELGGRRDELFPGCRSFMVERHVDYYAVQERRIVVGRILHNSQDPAGRLSAPAET